MYIMLPDLVLLKKILEQKKLNFIKKETDFSEQCFLEILLKHRGNWITEKFIQVNTKFIGSKADKVYDERMKSDDS